MLAIGATSVAATAVGIVAVRAGILPGPALAVLALTPLAAAELVAGLPDAAVRLLTARPAARRLAELEVSPAAVAAPHATDGELTAALPPGRPPGCLGYGSTGRDGTPRAFPRVADPDLRVDDRADPEHREPVGHLRELRERRPAVHRDVRATARCDLQVPPQDRRPGGRVDLVEQHRLGDTVAQDRVPARGPHVVHPARALAEHRHEVALTLVARYHHRQGDDPAGATADTSRADWITPQR